MKLIPVLISITALALAGANLRAQEFPARPVRIVVPLPAGGPADTLGRSFAQELGGLWKQPVLIDNRPGATGIIGTEFVVKSPPDGHTILFIDSSIAVNDLVHRRLPYDSSRDLVGVTALVRWRGLMVASSQLPATGLKELVALAKASPGKLNYGSYGIGSSPHVALEMFKSLAGIDMVHVPYKGSGPVITDLMSGVLQIGFVSLNSSRGALKEGRIRALAVDGAKRVAELPDVATFAEQGYAEMQANSIWFGFFVPAAVPPDVVEKIHRDTVALINDPIFREQKLTGRGYEPIGNTPQEFAAMIRATTARFAPIVKAANIRVE